MFERRVVLFVILIVITFSCYKGDVNTKLEYYNDSGIKSIKRYKNDTLNGPSQWFYENGNLERVIHFENGMANGNAYYFYENGTLKSFRYWRDDKMVGYVCDYYDDTVSMIKSVLFFDNEGYLVYKKNYDSLGNFLNIEGRKPVQ